MKPYMLVLTADDGSRTVQFYDEYENAVEGYNICVTSIGWNCELYAHKHLSECDRLPVSKEIMGYVKIM